MTDALTIDSKSSALLVMDFQNGIVGMLGDEAPALLTRTQKLLTAARAKNVRVVYVVVGFRAGYPEVSSRNASFAGLRDSKRFAPGDTAAEIHASVAPKGEDVIVTKHRVGAFLGTDFDMVLRANNVDTLIFTGIATSGVVLSTLRYAADADYRCVVAADCCADRDEEVHRVLTEKVFARQGTVTNADAIIAALK